MKQPKPGQPISLCCNAIMIAQPTKDGCGIEYIFCRKCKGVIDETNKLQIENVYKPSEHEKT